MFGLGNETVTDHAMRLTVKLIVLSIFVGFVSALLMRGGPIVIFVWGIVATFLTIVVFLGEVDELISVRLAGHDSSWDRGGTSPPRRNSGRKSREDASDLETVKRHQQKSEPGWVMLRGEKYMHRKIDEDDRGEILEVGDGNRTGRFLVRGDQIEAESPELEQEYGEEWVNEAKSYLEEYAV